MEAEAPAPSKSKASGAPALSPAAQLAALEPVTIVIEEKLVCQLKKDGGLEAMEVQGTMMLEVNNDEDAFCRVAISGGQNKALQFKTHPNIDKALHANSNVLGLKDASRPFPTGSALGVLKWRMQAKDESSVPLSINCWPSVSGTQSFVSIEYEASEARTPPGPGPSSLLHGGLIASNSRSSDAAQMKRFFRALTGPSRARSPFLLWHPISAGYGPPERRHRNPTPGAPRLAAGALGAQHRTLAASRR